MRKSVFYWVTGLLLVISIIHAGYRTLSSDEVYDTRDYPQTSSQERLAEYNALLEESKNPRVDPDRYFQTLVRFDRLDKAISRARANGELAHDALHGEVTAGDDAVTLRFIMNQYVNDALRNMPHDKKFLEAKERSNYDPFAGDKWTDPLTPMSWALVYFFTMILTFGRFVITLEEMGGSWWMAALTDWRFPFYLLICPIGIFRYPTEVDVVMQAKRAWRFAVLILTSSLTLASAACAGKRIKTEVDDAPVDTAKTWVVNMDTTVWPSYIGGNGAVFHPDAVDQTSATLVHKSGVYAGTWVSTPMSRTSITPNFAREIDGSVGWNGKSVLGIETSVDLTLVGVTPIRRYSGDVMQTSISLGRDVKVRGQTLTPYFIYRHATPVRGGSPGSGTFLLGGARTGFAFGRLSGGVKAEYMHDTGAFGFSSGSLLSVSANIGMNIMKHLRAEVPVRSSLPLTTRDARRSELQVGFRLAVQ